MMISKRLFPALILALPALTAVAQNDQYTCEPPRLLGMLPTLDHPVTLTIDGDYAYIGQNDDSLLIVDISDPHNPTLLSRTTDLPLWFKDDTNIVINNGAAYIGGSIVNVEDKTDPWFMRYYGFPYNIFDNYIYRSSGSSGFTSIYDTSRQFSPALVVEGFPLDLEGGTPTARIGNDIFTDNLIRFSIDDPLNPVLIDQDNSQPFGTTGRSRYEAPYMLTMGGSDNDPVVHTYNEATDAFSTVVLEGLSTTDYTVRGNMVFSVLEGLHIHTLTNPTTHIASYDSMPGIDGAQFIRRHNEHFVILSNDTLAIFDIPTNPVAAASSDVQLAHLELMGNTAILSSGNIDTSIQGTSVFDISEPTQPRWIAQLPTPNAFGIDSIEPLVFIADKFDGLKAFDLTDPANPELVGTYNTSTNQAGTPNTRDVFVAGSHLFAADRNSGITIYDATNPQSLQPIATLSIPQAVQRVAVDNNLAFVSTLSDLYIIDVSNPASPTILSTIPEPPATTNYIHTAKRQGNLLYTADSDNGYRVFEISDPTNPALLAQFDADITTKQGEFEAFVYDFVFDQNLLYIAMSWTGFAVYDNTDPFNPVLLRHVLAADPPLSAAARYRDLELQGDLLYTSAGNAGMRIFDTTDCAPPCSIDFNADGQINFYDVTIFIQAYTSEDLLADLNGDGELSFFDIANFLALYNKGCP